MLKIFVSCNERQNLIKLVPPLTSAVKNIFYESICFYREINYYCSGERYFTGTSVLREIPLEISSGCRINIVGFARSLFFFFLFLGFTTQGRCETWLFCECQGNDTRE